MLCQTIANNQSDKARLYIKLTCQILLIVGRAVCFSDRRQDSFLFQKALNVIYKYIPISIGVKSLKKLKVFSFKIKYTQAKMHRRPQRCPCPDVALTLTFLLFYIAKEQLFQAFSEIIYYGVIKMGAYAKDIEYMV